MKIISEEFYILTKDELRKLLADALLKQYALCLYPDSYTGVAYEEACEMLDAYEFRCKAEEEKRKIEDEQEEPDDEPF